MPQHAGKEAEVEAILTAYADRVYPAADGQPLGSFDPERIKAVQDFYIAQGIVQTAVPVEDLYTNESSCNEPRRRRRARLRPPARVARAVNL